MNFEMDNKILLELIKKDLNELHLMVDMLYKSDKVEKLVIELTTTKAQTLLQEILMLKTEPEIQSVEQEIAFEPEPIKVEAVLQPEIQVEAPVVVETPIAESVPEVVMLLTETEIIEEVLSPEDDILPEVEALPEVEIAPEVIVVEEVPPVVAAIEPVVEQKIETVIENNKEEPIQIINEKPADAINNDLLIESKVAVEKKVFGEQFSKEPSLNERLGAKNSTEAMVKPQPVPNIKSAIGLNDRFLYTRILFNNSSKLFDETIEQLEKSANLMEAFTYLESNFVWEKHETSLKFIDILKRRFQN